MSYHNLVKCGGRGRCVRIGCGLRQNPNVDSNRITNKHTNNHQNWETHKKFICLSVDFMAVVPLRITPLNAEQHSDTRTNTEIYMQLLVSVVSSLLSRVDCMAVGSNPSTLTWNEINDEQTYKLKLAENVYSHIKGEFATNTDRHTHTYTYTRTDDTHTYGTKQQYNLAYHMSYNLRHLNGMTEKCRKLLYSSLAYETGRKGVGECINMLRVASYWYWQLLCCMR